MGLSHNVTDQEVTLEILLSTILINNKYLSD